MRLLYARSTCVLCNVDNPSVAVVPAASYDAGVHTLDAAAAAAAAAGTRLFDDRASRMRFVSAEVRDRLQRLAGFTCPRHVAALEAAGGDDGGGGAAAAAAAAAACGAPTHRSIGALRAHVRDEHKALFCDVCVASKVEYKALLPVYPLDAGGAARKSAALAEHVKAEHPACRFCGTHFLGDDELFAHLQKEHEACHICERAGRLHEYFRNFSTLEAHYRSQHFVCDDPGCRGVVYASVLDLQAHMLSRHRSELPRNARGRRMQVDLAELHAPAAGRSGRGGGGAPARGGGRGGVAVHGVRHGPADAAAGDGGRVVPPPALMSDEDVRLEQERQAARRREFRASRIVFSADDSGDAGASAVAPAESGGATDGGGAGRGRRAGGGGRRGGEASQTSNTGRQVTAGGRRSGGGASGAESASTEAATSSGGARPAVEEAPPDDGAFYERAPPESPEEQASRSKVLVGRMRAALDPAEFEQFRSFSGDFRNQRMSAEDYYNATVESFGVRSAVRDILPELAALLPNADVRTQLTKVCTHRNPPPFSASGARTAPRAARSDGFGASAPPAGTQQSLRPPSSSVDSFPTLAGGPATTPAIRPSAPRMRAAPPKSADFPRLGNGPAPAPAASRAQAAPGATMQPSVDRMFGTSSAGQAPGAKGPPPSAAASVMAAPALASSAFPSLSGSSSNGSASKAARAPRPQPGPSIGLRPTSADFPSLGGSSASSSDSPSGGAPAASPASAASPAFAAAPALAPAPAPAPAPDVSDRAGAVWGGASTGRGGKKRGPGRGSTPAPLPSGYGPRVVRSGPIPDAPRPANGHGAEQKGGGGGSAVIDVAALSLNKQAKSALPRVSAGGSYGFAWERKKVRSKQREIKREVKGKTGASSGASAAGEARASAGFKPELSPESAPDTGPASAAAEPEPAGAANDGESDGARAAPAQVFDQFSYLNAGSMVEDREADPASSFLGA